MKRWIEYLVDGLEDFLFYIHDEKPFIGMFVVPVIMMIITDTVYSFIIGRL